MMNNIIDLEKLERQVHTSRFQDGLWDLYFGLILLLVWVFFQLMNSGFTGIKLLVLYTAALTVLMIAHRLALKLVSARRMGTVKPGPQRRMKLRRLRWVLGASVLLLAAMVLLTSMFFTGYVRIPDFWFKIAGGLVVFLPIAAIAYWNDLPRIFLYAVVLGGGISIFLIARTALTFLIGGLIITTLGSIMFIRFLRANPLPEVEKDHE